MENKDILRKKAYDGLEELCLHKNQEYLDRLEFELKTVEELGFVPYFLVMWDITKFARENKILYGPGRGSGCGSLLNYCLKITLVDPIKYGLYFERFLNPSRVSPPDIDWDCAERDRIIDYLKERYGADRVARVGSLNFLRTKSAIRDIGRVLNKSFAFVEELTNLVPPPVAGLWTSFESECEVEPHLLAEKYEEITGPVKKLWGVVRSYGTHAGGVAIAPGPINQFVPLYKDKDGNPVSQFDWRDLEAAGLLKFDILGLNTLEVIQLCMKYINDKGVELDLETLPDGDKKTYELIQSGNLDGVFQLGGSESIKQLTVQIAPKNIEDLSLVTSLFRPGPLCLSGDSKILTGIQKTRTKKTTSDGYMTKTLKMLHEWFCNKTVSYRNKHPRWVISVAGDIQSPVLVKSKIRAIHKTAPKELFYIIITSCLSGPNAGLQTLPLKSSKDHGFLTLRQEWKTLERLRPGDYICILNRTSAGVRKSCGKIPGRKNFRNLAFYNYEQRCIFCDWQKGSLDTNHDKDNRNISNHQDNLSFLCPNHHREYTEGSITVEELKREKEKFRLPPPGELRWVRFEGTRSAGYEDTYDIELYDPHHNFIANDIVVHNSSGMVEDAVAVRQGIKEEFYLHPLLEDILKPTHCVPVFQEQVMRICTDLCGYTLPEADMMRKILGKKLKDKMKEQRPKFVSGAISNGCEEADAEKLFSQLQDYAQYLFNKAHAVAYSIITYWTGYLKAHHPTEFYAALLACETKPEMITQYASFAKDNGIEILPPDVNESEVLHTPENGAIRFGLGHIKGMPRAAAESIVRIRNENG